MQMKLLKKLTVWTLILTLGLLFVIPSNVSAAARVSPVKALKLQRVNGTQIRLKWKPSGNCTGYAIYRRNPSTGTYKIIGKIANKKKTSFTDVNTNANLKQKYAVKAYRKVKGSKSLTSTAKRASWAGYQRDAYIGHRGAMDVAPENTMASFQKAHDVGYQVFECDVWWTDSKELLVAHDANLAKICGVPGSIFEVTSSTRNNYPIKTKNYENYPTQYFPTMEEVLAFCSRTNMKVLFHFRYYRMVPELPAQAINKASQLIKNYKMTNKAMVISSNTKDLDRFVKKQITTGYVSGARNQAVRKQALLLAAAHKSNWILFPYISGSSLTKKFIKSCHQKGIKTLNYNVLSPGVVKTLVNNGCDAWVTNRIIF